MGDLMFTPSSAKENTLFPAGGWDTHFHIFAPKSFPYSEHRHLTPPEAPISAYLQFRSGLGLTKTVLAHGLSYGDDCSSLKAFAPQLNSEQPRAIAVIDPEATTDDEIKSLHASGTRGVRVNLYRYKAMEDVELQKKALLAHLRRITALDLPWNLTMTTTRTDFWDHLGPFIHDSIVSTGVQMITDHFALLKAPSMLSGRYQEDPTSQPGFEAIIRLVRSGSLWVKLSAPYRVSEASPDYADLRFLVRALVEANKRRVIWGSDWPHTPRMKVRSAEDAKRETPFLEVDDEAWLRSLKSWLSDEEWHLLMVENPQTLFGASANGS